MSLCFFSAKKTCLLRQKNLALKLELLFELEKNLKEYNQKGKGFKPLLFETNRYAL